MTDETTIKGKAPTHVAYHVQEREGDRGYWTRIGAAWQHKDGKGFNVQLHVQPLDGRITLRIAAEQQD